MGSLMIRAAAVSDVGCKRKNNEDSILSLPDRLVFCVADGMGGAREGQVASQALTDTLAKAFATEEAGRLDLPAKIARIKVTVEQVNAWIKQRIEERGFTQMGSTVVVGLLDAQNPSRGVVLNAGDSRMYRFRARNLQQLTTDHTFVAELGAKNESALPVEFRGVVTKAVGLRDEIVLDEVAFNVQTDDLFFLCSDGLTRMLSDKFMQNLLRQIEPLEPVALARLLVGEAKKAGGDDNVSVVVIRVDLCGSGDNKFPLPLQKPSEPSTASTSTDIPPTPTHGAQPDEPPVTPRMLGDKTPDTGIVEGYTPRNTDNHSGSASTEKTPIFRRSLGQLFRWLGQHKTGVVVMAAGVLLLGLFAVKCSRRQGKEAEPEDVVINIIPLESETIGQISDMNPTVFEESRPAEPEATSPAGLEPSSSLPESTESQPLAPGASPVGALPAGPIVLPESSPAESTLSPLPASAESNDSRQVIPGEFVSPPPADSDDHPPVSFLESPAMDQPPAEWDSVLPARPDLSPEEIAQEQQTAEERGSLARARSAVTKPGHFEKSGKWGKMREDAGTWWGKLGELEPRAEKRIRIQAWVALWDEIAHEEGGAQAAQRLIGGLQKTAETFNLNPPVVDPLGFSGENLADQFCQAYHELQFQLLKGVGAFAKGQRRQIDIIADIWDSYCAELCMFVGEDAAMAGLFNSREQLKAARESAEKMEEWVEARHAAGMPVDPDQYPAGDVAVIMNGADVAAGRLVDMIQEMNSAIAYKRGNVNAAAEAQLGVIELLQWKVIQDKGDQAVREWRNNCDWSRVRKMLQEVAGFMSGPAGQPDAAN